MVPIENTPTKKSQGLWPCTTTICICSAKFRSGRPHHGKRIFCYGNVTLNESLTINQGETLTIPQGTTLNTNGNLNNDGTIVNKGTMNGDPTGGSGTVVSTPTITTASLPDGTAGQSYTAIRRPADHSVHLHKPLSG